MKEINLYLILFIFIISSVLIFVFSDRIMKKHKKLLNEDFQNLDLISTEQLEDRFNNEDVKERLHITNLKIEKPNNTIDLKHLSLEGFNLDLIRNVYVGNLKGDITRPENVGSRIDDEEKQLIRIIPPNFENYYSTTSTTDINKIDLEIKLEVNITGNNSSSSDMIEKQITYVLETNQVNNGRNELNIVNIDNNYSNNPSESNPPIPSPSNFDYDFTESQTDISRNGFLKFEISGVNRAKIDASNSLVNLKIKLNTEKQTRPGYNSLNLNGNSPITLKIFEGESNERDINFDINNSEHNFELYLSKNNFNALNPNSDNFYYIPYQISTNEVFRNNPSLGEFKFVNTIVQIPVIEVTSIFPTGLFYKFNILSAGDRDFSSWNLFVNNRLEGEENNRNIFGNDLRTFYSDIVDATTVTEEDPPPPPSFKVDKNSINWELNDEEDIYKLSWQLPEAELSHRFAFIININAQANDDNFQIKDEQIAPTKNFYQFSYKKLIPTYKYNVQISTFRTDLQKIVERSDIKELTYEPENLADYHKHIFDENGNIIGEKTQDRQQLLTTYYKLKALNKLKTNRDIEIAAKEINEASQCTDGNLNNMESSSNTNNFDEKIKEYITNSRTQQNSVFYRTQFAQDDRMKKIQSKLSELEKLQGKANLNQNTKIKSIKSKKDNTELGLTQLDNDQYMVHLNKGCLKKSKNGDYGYVPCNVFDKEQYFDLDKIDNYNEYNNLLLMNRNPELPRDLRVEYPFYVLKPRNSEKCVAIDNNKLLVKACDDEDDIKFNGYFASPNCNK